MAPILYGIKNCGTVQKARDWLHTRNIEYRFHDYKAVGIDRAAVAAWCDEFGWEAILNRAGTTFRKLGDSQRQDIDTEKAIELMLAQPSMIKRPILELANRRLVGFKPDSYAAAFGAG